MLRRWLALVQVVLAVLLLPRAAHADTSTAHTVPVAVLALDSDDAEDQADALTGALRSRVRASQGWSLVETSQSLGMLTAALRCPGKPVPADCEQRIADHIKSERYIFGYVTKGPQSGQVTAEIHLYQKSKPDTVIRESYADNLKDQNEDTLRKIAQRLLDRLGGNAVGTLVVRLGSENGEVIVDGDKRVPLQNGTARLELSPGGHSVEIAVTGQPAQKRNVVVTAGKETVVDLALAAPTGEPSKPPKPFPTRKFIGGVAMVVGAGLGVLAVAETLHWAGLQDKVDASPDRSNIDTKGMTVPACDAVDRSGTTNHAPCELSKEAEKTSAIAIASGAVGGLLLIGGAYLLLTDSSEAKPATSGKKAPKVRVVPNVGYTAAGLVVSGSF